MRSLRGELIFDATWAAQPQGAEPHDALEVSEEPSTPLRSRRDCSLALAPSGSTEFEWAHRWQSSLLGQYNNCSSFMSLRGEDLNRSGVPALTGTLGRGN